MGWNSLNEEYFVDSGFSINCIFGFSVLDLKNHFPETFMISRDTHEQFLKFISDQSSFAYFCRKPFQMHLFYDTFHEVLSHQVPH